MPYADQPRSLTHNAPKRGRGGAAYRALSELVRERVRQGARCYFWRRRGHEACPGRIDLRLPSNHRWAFTAHHLRRLMDGGSAVVRAEEMVPAHRACNARDGLMAQNARRARQRVGIPSITMYYNVAEAAECQRLLASRHKAIQRDAKTLAREEQLRQDEERTRLRTERALEALALAKAGWKWKEIAEAVGYSSSGAAYNAVEWITGVSASLARHRAPDKPKTRAAVWVARALERQSRTVTQRGISKDRQSQAW